MAIALDTATNSSGPNTNVSTVSWSHTCTGSNLLLVAGVAMRDVSSGTVSVSKIEYPTGTNFTFIRDDDNAAVNVAETELWHLEGPAAGANTVTITMSAALNELAGAAISLTGVTQTGQPDAQNGTSGTASVTSESATITTVADNSWIVDVTRIGNTPTGVTSTNGTVRTSFVGTNLQIEMSTQPTTTHGAQTDGYSWTTASTSWAMSGASFSPAGGVSATLQDIIGHGMQIPVART